MFICPIYHNWRNISTIYIYIYIYITRIASNKIFSPSNKIHLEVGRAKDLSLAPHPTVPVRNLWIHGMYSYVYIYIYICVCVCVCMYICMFMYVSVCVCVVYVYVHIWYSVYIWHLNISINWRDMSEFLYFKPQTRRHAILVLLPEVVGRSLQD